MKTVVFEMKYSDKSQVPDEVWQHINRLLTYGHDVEYVAKVFQIPVEWILPREKPHSKDFH